MAMPLRVVQRYMVVDGEKVWTTYTLEVLGEWGWETVPVVEQEEKAPQEPVRRGNVAEIGQL